MKIKFQGNEFWYGTCVKYGMRMPIGPDTETELDLTSNPTPNQEMPLLVSTKGRCLWSEEGFHIRIRSGVIEVPDSYQLEETGGGLREAYLHAMQKHFPFRGMPAENLFGRIIYNTWIELTYHQNEEDILAYAGRILESRMPPGVLMIDDGWAECYGDWRFHSGKFPHPEQMIEIRNLIKKLGKKHTVIFSSHILSEVQAVCDRVVVIKEGKILADDTPEHLEEKLAGKQLRICVIGPEKEVSQALKKIPGVLEISNIRCQENGSCAFDVKVEDEYDARRRIAAYMKQSPWLLTEITVQHLSLEDIFLKLTGKKGGKKL